MSRTYRSASTFSRAPSFRFGIFQLNTSGDRIQRLLNFVPLRTGQSSCQQSSTTTGFVVIGYLHSKVDIENWREDIKFDRADRAA